MKPRPRFPTLKETVLRPPKPQVRDARCLLRTYRGRRGVVSLRDCSPPELVSLQDSFLGQRGPVALLALISTPSHTTSC